MTIWASSQWGISFSMDTYVCPGMDSQDTVLGYQLVRLTEVCLLEVMKGPVYEI